MHSIGKLLAVALPVLEGEVEVARDVFEFVEGRLAREALEQVSGRLVVLVVFCDEPFERELEGDAGAEAVTVGVVSQANWASFQNGTTESPGDVAEVVPELVEGLPLDERVDVRLGGLSSAASSSSRTSAAAASSTTVISLASSWMPPLRSSTWPARRTISPSWTSGYAHAGLLEGGTRDDAEPSRTWKMVGPPVWLI